MRLGNRNFNLEVADTNELIIKGLSGRKSLKADHGMIFIYEKPDLYSFWMKEMRFPLDFIWIRENSVVDLSENIPAPSNENIPVIVPRNPVDKVIEVKAGTIKSINLKIGDKIIIK